MNTLFLVTGYAAIVCLTVPSFLEVTRRLISASGDRPDPSKGRVLAVALTFAVLWLPLLSFTLLAAAYRFFKLPFEKGADIEHNG